MYFRPKVPPSVWDVAFNLNRRMKHSKVSAREEILNYRTLGLLACYSFAIIMNHFNYIQVKIL